MQRTCPDCYGFKYVDAPSLCGGMMRVKCHTCDGTGYVTGKRPHKRQSFHRRKIRLRTPKEIRERREADKQFNNSFRKYLR